MTTATCIVCGGSFHRDEADAWKVRCLPCWQASKRRTQREQPRDDHAMQIRDELAANLRVLLQLTHPDRHNGSAAATRATQWLLQVQQRLQSLEAA